MGVALLAVYLALVAMMKTKHVGRRRLLHEGPFALFRVPFLFDEGFFVVAHDLRWEERRREQTNRYS